MARIRIARLSLSLALAAALLPVTAGAATLHRIAPPAAWVEPARADYDAKAPANPGGGGTVFLLLDRQIDVTAAGHDYYEHSAARLTSEDGVAERSQLNIGIDPSFQSLDIHFMRIVRGGTVIDQSRRARITELPEETELENRIYNGDYNVNVLLSDVRIGDIVEYAYTIHSRDTLFPRHFAARLWVGWSTPLHLQRIRIRSPLDRPLHARLTNGGEVPAFQVRGNARELVIESRDVPLVAAEDGPPSWYSPWHSLVVSDLANWAEAARLVDPLYVQPMRKSAPTVAIASEIAAAGGTKEEQALRALQYVQEQIRYTSIAIGYGSHKPSHPDTVLERRFGDCKDKSVLLVVLLRELGIEAHPALVHTRRGKVLGEQLPTPYAFDHVIVRMKIGENVYWVDGTASKQYTPLSTENPADFEHALLVGAGARDLVAIPRPSSDARRREVSMVFDLRDGEDRPAKLEMTTRYVGALADEMRTALARSSAEQRASNYVNYIARYYPGAKSAGDVTIDDDKSRNVIEVHEHYTLEPAFTDNNKGRVELMLHGDEIYSYTQALSSSVRKSPLALEFPIHVRQNIVVYFADGWPAEPATAKIENAAFRYESDVRYSASTLEITYDYEALADHVAPAALQTYLADRRRAHDDVGYVLSNDSADAAPRAFAIAPLPFFVLLGSLALGLWFAIRRLYRWDPAPREAEPGAPEGFGGWLIIPMLGVVIGPFLTLTIVYYFGLFIEAAMWDTLPGLATDAFAPWIQPIILGTLGLSALLLGSQVVLAVLFFQKRSSAPLVLFAIYIYVTVVFTVSNGALLYSGLDDETTHAQFIAESIRNTVSAVLWSAYLLRSQRVKATFRRRAGSEAAMPEPVSSLA